MARHKKGPKKTTNRQGKKLPKSKENQPDRKNLALQTVKKPSNSPSRRSSRKKGTQKTTSTKGAKNKPSVASMPMQSRPVSSSDDDGASTELKSNHDNSQAKPLKNDNLDLSGSEVVVVPQEQERNGPTKEERHALTRQKEKNVSDIENHLDKEISTTIEDDHCFFSKPQDKDHFEALLKDSFVPQNISDPDDEIHCESMAQHAHDHITIEEDEDD